MFTSQAVGKDGGILLEIFMERDKVKANENAKIRKRQISSYLDRTSLVNKGFIIRLKT